MRALVWICLLVIAIPSFAQEKFTASVDHTTVRAGELVTLTLAFSGAVSGVGAPMFPALEKLQLAGGPYTSTNFSFVNGHASSTTSYSYSLRAMEAGTGRIGEGVVKYKGKEYHSIPITVNIITSGSASGSGGKGGETSDVFIKVYPDKVEAYLGEQITLTYKIYFDVQISNLEPSKSPGTTGFWVEEYPLPQQLAVTREVVNGRAYSAAIFKKIALFPTSVGILEVTPLAISTRVQRAVRRRSMDPFDIFNDPFFGLGGAQLEQIEVQSPGVRLNVKPLLQAAVPAGFAGAVGSFKVQAALDHMTCKTGEAVTLTVSVSGSGNIKTLPEPVISYPPDVDHYDPEASDEIGRNQPQISGTKTFKYVVIPRAPGTQVIPAITYPYFDPEHAKYVSVTTAELRLQVEKGEGSAVSAGRSVAEKRKVESVATDIAYVKTNPGNIYHVGNLPHTSLEFWGFSIAPWGAVAAAMLVSRKRQRLIIGKRGALLKARKQLGQGEKALRNGRTEVVLRQVAASLDTVLSGAIGMDVTEMTSDSLAERWESEQLDPDLLRGILEVRAECDRDRFAAGAEPSKSLGPLIEKTRGILERVGRSHVKEGART